MTQCPEETQSLLQLVSIVIPVYNEEDSLPHLFHSLDENLKKYPWPVEIILVNDGSTDKTFELLNQKSAEDDRFKIVHFRRNFGQTAAFSAGFDFSNGDVIVTLDADMQNDPADVPLVLDKLQEGYDIVSGWRKDRQDGFVLRILPSRIANKLISLITNVHLHDYGCTLKAYRKGVIDNLYLYGELHRFIPALASMVGSKVIEIPVNHHAREHGTSKYGIGRTFKVILDLLTVKFLLKYMVKPMHFFGNLGMIFIAGGFALLVYLLGLKLCCGTNMTGSPLLILSTVTAFSGLHFVIVGLIAEIVVRVYFETKKQPTYYVKDARGFASKQLAEHTIVQ